MELLNIVENRFFNRAKFLKAPKKLRRFQWETLWIYSCGFGETFDDIKFVEFEFQNGDFKLTITENNLLNLLVLEDKVVVEIQGTLGHFINQDTTIEFFLE